MVNSRKLYKRVISLVNKSKLIKILRGKKMYSRRKPEIIYISAKANEQLKRTLINAKVQKVPDSTDVVCYGTLVSAIKKTDAALDENVSFAVVGHEDEEFLKKNSVELPADVIYVRIGSAISNAIIGKKVGDREIVFLPKNINYYLKINSIGIIDYLRAE